MAVAGPSHADGEIAQAPAGVAYLRCEDCGDLLRFLTWFGGRALCRRCVSERALGRGRR